MNQFWVYRGMKNEKIFTQSSSYWSYDLCLMECRAELQKFKGNGFYFMIVAFDNKGQEIRQDKFPS